MLLLIIHKEKQMIKKNWFYKNNIGMERTNYKRVEMKALVDSALKCGNYNYSESSNQQSEKHEAYTL